MGAREKLRRQKRAVQGAQQMSISISKTLLEDEGHLSTL